MNWYIVIGVAVAAFWVGKYVQYKKTIDHGKAITTMVVSLYEHAHTLAKRLGYHGFFNYIANIDSPTDANALHKNLLELIHVYSMPSQSSYVRNKFMEYENYESITTPLCNDCIQKDETIKKLNIELIQIKTELDGAIRENAAIRQVNHEYSAKRDVNEKTIMQLALKRTAATLQHLALQAGRFSFYSYMTEVDSEENAYDFYDLLNKCYSMYSDDLKDAAHFRDFLLAMQFGGFDPFDGIKYPFKVVGDKWE